ncbi:hypothetical protein [Sphingobacterium faecium]|uniref:hypothetical protein n=1 Tax=Sphingobacterium faecium TaxID=34087 RepID=UPI00247A8BE2|nr:hypothetical protein [Sphingobacterium faecium]WGQ17069.1 hypothetical protein QG727_22755 [Sphingobacterium faecium]
MENFSDIDEYHLTIEIHYINNLYIDEFDPCLNYVNEVELKIKASDEHNDNIEIGTGHLYLLELETAYYNDIDIYDLIDHYSYLENYFSSLINFEEGLYVFDKTENEIENCILISEVKLINEFQGKGIFNEIVRHIEKIFSSNYPYTFLQAFPLQYEGYLNKQEHLDKIEKYHKGHKKISKKKSIDNLKSAYGKAGFIPSKIDHLVMYKYNGE